VCGHKSQLVETKEVLHQDSYEASCGESTFLAGTGNLESYLLQGSKEGNEE